MTIFEKAVQLVDSLSAIPGEIQTIGLEENLPGVADFGGDANDKVIRLATDLRSAQNQSAAAVEENLKETKIRTLGSKAATWLSKPRNLGIAGAVILLILIGVRKL